MTFEEFADALATNRRRAAGCQLVVVSSVGSTNDLARRILEATTQEGQQVVPPVLVVAWQQTAGRGRRERRWESPAGKGVYASLGIVLERSSSPGSLPLLVGVGMCRALNRFLPSASPCRLKWPNDLLVGAKKLGGILVECRSVRPAEVGAVIGWGVNCRHGPDDLPQEGTSLERETESSPSLAAVAWSTASGVLEELKHLGDLPYAVREYLAHTVHEEGERIRCRTGSEVLEGIFRGLDESGRLRLEIDGDIRKVSSGEVS